MRILNMLLTIIATSPVAVAQATDCTDATNQVSMNVCANQAYKKTDAELNAIYKQITGRLKSDKETAELLVTAQKSWLGFRDAECAFSTSAAAQGSIHPMLLTQCRTGLTNKRIIELKTYHKLSGAVRLSCQMTVKSTHVVQTTRTRTIIN